MATVCTACGTENRDKARYCRGCARPLVPLGTPEAPAEPAAEAAPPHHRTRRSRSRAARQRRTAIRWGLGVAVLVAGLVAWRLWPGDAPVQPAWAKGAPVAQGAAPVPVSTPSLSVSTATTPSAVTVAAATTTLPGKALQPVAPAKPVSTPPRPKPAQARAVHAAPVAVAVPVTAVRNDASTSAPVAEAPPTPAPKTRSVDDSCADRSNFLTRDICRIQACGNPAMAGDPVCVRFREMEAANRRTGN